MDLRRPSTWGFLLLLAGALTYVVERWIVTDAEEIEETIEAAVDAAANGDTAALAGFVDDAYQHEGRDKDAVVRYVESERSRYRPRGISADVSAIEITDDEASAKVSLKVKNPFTNVRVGVRMARRETGWKVTQAWLEGWNWPGSR